MSGADKNYLWQLFQRVDTDKSGEINSVELQSALSNGTWTPFNPETIRVMISMFDRDNSSTINFDEFSSLWKYIDDWQKCFRSFDKDNSGSIDKNELKLALTTFGYRLPDKFYDIAIKSIIAMKKRAVQQNTAQKLNSYQNGNNNRNLENILFDDFIYVCCKIQTLTHAFKQYDYQHSGVMTIKYEDFLTMIFSLNI